MAISMKGECWGTWGPSSSLVGLTSYLRDFTLFLLLFDSGEVRAFIWLVVMLRQLTSLLVPSSLTPTASLPDPTVCAAVVFPSVVSQNSQAGALLLLQQGQPSIVNVVLMEIQITFQTGPLGKNLLEIYQDFKWTSLFCIFNVVVMKITLRKISIFSSASRSTHQVIHYLDLSWKIPRESINLQWKNQP